MKSRGMIILIAMLAASISVLIYAGYNLDKVCLKYWEGYQKTETVYTVAKRSEQTVDWESLCKANKDVIGWIYCPGTIIDYAVVQSHDNTEYLNLAPDRTYSTYGSIFADSRIKGCSFDTLYTVLYGHHMQDGAMFHDLDLWMDQEYVETHPQFYLYTPDENYTIDVFAAVLADSHDEIIYEKLPTTEIDDRNDLRDHVLSKSVIHTETKVKGKDRIIALSTCAYQYSGARTVIFGKLTPIEDEIEVIEMDKKRNYTKPEMFTRMIREMIENEYRSWTGGEPKE